VISFRRSLILKGNKARKKSISKTVASEFIHKLSHDVTGIMHNIIGYATLLEKDHNKTYVVGITKLATKLTGRLKQAVLEIDEEYLVQE
jgi:hypothetical protein